MRKFILSLVLAGFFLVPAGVKANSFDPVSIGQIIQLRQTDSSGWAYAMAQGGGPLRVDLSPFDPSPGGGISLRFAWK